MASATASGTGNSGETASVDDLTDDPSAPKPNTPAGTKKKACMGSEDLKNPMLWRQLVAEFTGVFFYVLVGCGSCQMFQHIGVVGISFCFGITFATLTQAFGHVSGAHFNPAVSFGLIPVGQCSLMKALVYSASQCFGSLFAAVTLVGISPQIRPTNDSFTFKYMFGFGATMMGRGRIDKGIDIVEYHYSWYQAFFVEFFITFVLVLTFCGVCDKLRKDVTGSVPLAIGLCITACHFFAIPISGASMNPARSLGPAFALAYANEWGGGQEYSIFHDNEGEEIRWQNWDAVAHLPFYFVACILGGVAAGFFYRFVFAQKKESEAVADTPVEVVETASVEDQA